MTIDQQIVGKSETELAQLYASLWRDQDIDRDELNWKIIGQIWQAGLQRVFAAAWAIVNKLYKVID